MCKFKSYNFKASNKINIYLESKNIYKNKVKSINLYYLLREIL